MITFETSAVIPEAGDASGQSISASTSSAVTTNAIGAFAVYIYSTVECFLVKGSSPTATVASGLPVPANVAMRLAGLDVSDKIAAITASGTGTVYIRPGA